MKFVFYIGLAVFLLSALADAVGNNTDFCRVWTLKSADRSMCKCAPINNLIECSENQTIIKYQACATYNESTRETLVGMCPFNSHELQVNGKLAIDYTVENRDLTSFMCDPLNRTGVLCSLCKDGLGPALLNYSYPCLKCSSYGWAAYFAATLIPSTILIVIIFVFQGDIVAPAVNYYVLHCHLMTYYFKQVPNLPNSLKKSTPSSLIDPMYKVLVTIFGIWNLDFFRSFIPSFCANSNMNILSVLALEYVVAIYPLLFTAAVYIIVERHARGCWLLNWLWRPLHPLRYKFKKAFNIRGSVINAFATSISVSFFKILMTSFDIACPATIYSSISRSQKNHLYFNSSIAFNDAKNIPYFVLAITMTTLFCVLPLLVLLTCPTKTEKCKYFYSCKLLCEVLKVFQKHLKDGTNGTPDYRSFSGLYFGFRILFLLTNYFTYTYRHYVRCLLSLLVAVLIAYFRPYKKNIYNCLDAFWFTELTVFTLTLLYQMYVSDNMLNLLLIGLGGMLPLFYICIFRVYWWGKILMPHLRCCCILLPRCCCKANQASVNMEEELPDRLENSSEYKPLLQGNNNTKQHIAFADS